jgi:hypothetical protein
VFSVHIRGAHGESLLAAAAIDLTDDDLATIGQII